MLDTNPGLFKIKMETLQERGNGLAVKSAYCSSRGPALVPSTPIIWLSPAHNSRGSNNSGGTTGTCTRVYIPLSSNIHII